MRRVDRFSVPTPQVSAENAARGRWLRPFRWPAASVPECDWPARRHRCRPPAAPLRCLATTFGCRENVK
ncbi:MAG: hypothetical protein AW07_01605 [Candidatus Accumulibacter sp. SK-11]|nr:MAG: hypothetical protein AW07_01605 [Candidatus Accumulibacter sp. SK-11]